MACEKHITTELNELTKLLSWWKIWNTNVSIKIWFGFWLFCRMIHFSKIQLFAISVHLYHKMRVTHFLSWSFVCHVIDVFLWNGNWISILFHFEMPFGSALIFYSTVLITWAWRVPHLHLPSAASQYYLINSEFRGQQQISDRCSREQKLSKHNYDECV